MNLVVATIPDNPVELASWLERRLAGLELDALVAELTALHRPGPDDTNLEQLLGPLLETIYRDGLSCLPREVLSRLLTRPALLLELQDRVLLHGGPYWDEVARSIPALQLLVERGAQRLPGTAPLPPRAQPMPAVPALPWYRRAWVASLATAATVLLAVASWLWFRPAQQPAGPTAWGWDRPGALREDSAPGDYLNGLAGAAQEWSRQRPETPQALARRIGQMRQGCSTLILAEHRPLKAEDRKWLVERCRAWAARFDRHLADLEAGKDALEVRREMDQTVERLVQALRERARRAA